jgi:hypothetical protein
MPGLRSFAVMAVIFTGFVIGVTTFGVGAATVRKRCSGGEHDYERGGDSRNFHRSAPSVVERSFRMMAMCRQSD